jgi:hypothetical protein
MWVRVATMHFTGLASVDWTAFCAMIHERFSRDQHKLLIRQLFHIRQTSPVQDYVDRFTALVDQLKSYNKTLMPFPSPAVSLMAFNWIFVMLYLLLALLHSMLLVLLLCYRKKRWIKVLHVNRRGWMHLRFGRPHPSPTHCQLLLLVYLELRQRWTRSPVTRRSRGRQGHPWITSYPRCGPIARLTVSVFIVQRNGRQAISVPQPCNYMYCKNSRTSVMKILQMISVTLWRNLLKGLDG